MKTEAIDGGHRRLLGVDASKFPSKQDERILVVGVHVLNDFGHRVSKRVGCAAVIFDGGYPTHHPKAAHVF